MLVTLRDVPSNTIPPQWARCLDEDPKVLQFLGLRCEHRYKVATLHLGFYSGRVFFFSDCLVPEIEPHALNKTVPEGEGVKLICKACGNPKPSLQWYKGPNLINLGEHLPRYTAIVMRRQFCLAFPAVCHCSVGF